MFYIENDKPAAELAAAIWLTYNHKYKKSFPVKVTDQITYNRPGITEGIYTYHMKHSYNIIHNPVRLSIHAQSLSTIRPL